MKDYKRLTIKNAMLSGRTDGKGIYNRLYELENAIENGTLIFNTDKFAECQDCPAWSGSDCTRHPYIEGCLKENDNNDNRRN